MTGVEVVRTWGAAMLRPYMIAVRCDCEVIAA